MSPPPHRKKDAKVEGRDPPETAPKETMAPFKSLMKRLLGVPMNEVRDQQRLYEDGRDEFLPKRKMGKVRKVALAALAPSLGAEGHPYDKQKISKPTKN